MTTELPGASPVERPVRPACWAFAMDFLGDPEAAEVEQYVTTLEAERAALRQALFDLWREGRPAAPDMNDEELRAWNSAADVLSEIRGPNG